MISWQNTIYPVTCEYQDEDGEWHEFIKLNNYEEAQSAILFHGVDVPDFTSLRMTEDDGTRTQHTKEELIEIRAISEMETRSQFQKLEQFVTAAPEDASHVALELITGALAAQHFVIPFMARVNIGHESLSHMTIKENAQYVACQIYEDEVGKSIPPVVTFWKDLEAAEQSPEIPVKEDTDTIAFSFRPFTVPAGVQGFLILLCATIIRDFWVLHEQSRTQQYQKHTKKTRERKGKGKERKLKITKSYTYVPRFEYDFETYKLNKNVQHNTRRELSPHTISGHLRRLPEEWQASKEATENAKEFGITLNEGQTFVKPYERGALNELQNFKSKSAMKMLFGKKKQ